MSIKWSLYETNLTLYTGFYLPPGSPLTVPVALNFSALSYTTSRSRTFIENAASEMDLTDIPGEDNVLQSDDQSLAVCILVLFGMLKCGKSALVSFHFGDFKWITFHYAVLPCSDLCESDW
jgi:hypothetical protein